MEQRLQKILSAYGIASRRKAEEMIQKGLVTVNGRPVEIGCTADPDRDEIRVEGKLLPSMEQKRYIILNKPRGYVTTLSDEKGRKNAAQLVADCGARVYPVGRLDMDSEGLLLFTNDGEFANAMMHPRGEIRKTYEVWVIGYCPGREELLKRQVTLDGYTIRQPEVRLLQAAERKAKLEIVIHEGRNRQIRRMCEFADMQVTRLRRIREGELLLGNLPLGKWRDLTEQELVREMNRLAMCPKNK